MTFLIFLAIWIIGAISVPRVFNLLGVNNSHGVFDHDQSFMILWFLALPAYGVHQIYTHTALKYRAAKVAEIKALKDKLFIEIEAEFDRRF